MRLPINPILYLVSAGLLAGSGLLFQQTLTARKSRAPTEIKADAEKVIQAGRDLEPEGLSDRYGGDARAFWMQVATVNLTGKLPPEPVAVEVQEKPPETAVPVVPVADLLTVITILHDLGDVTDSQVVVRYKPAAGVEPPALPATAAYSGPGDATQPPGPGAVSRGPAPFPMDPNLRLIHAMRLEETLWAPHQHLRLIRIHEDGESVVFLREDPKKERSEWQEERVFKDSLNLGQRVLEELARAGIAARTERPSTQDPEPSAPAIAGDVVWIDNPDGLTYEREPRKYHVGSKDQDMLNNDFQQVVEQVGLSDYTSRTGSIRGVQFGRVPPDLRRFGVQEGDVLISVNGEPTPNRSTAIKVGKEQYRRGAREFKVRFYRGGREMEQTYYASK